jgi:hypothetical protein
MTRLAKILHLDDGEFPALREQIEAKPLPVRPASKPLGWGRAMLDHLREQDATDAVEQATNARHTVVARLVTQLNAPLLQVDFAAWLADDWTHVNGRLDNLDDALGREFARWSAYAEYAASALVSPVLAEVADLTKTRLPEWRRALALHTEAELALYGAKAVEL